jgi:uncharacterized membrane protein
MQKRDYYDILGVSRDASMVEIKNAFRRLALHYHPDHDKSPEAEERFKELSEAFAVLSNAEKREQYDQLGRSGMDLRYTSEDIFKGVDFQDIFQGYSTDVVYRKELSSDGARLRSFPWVIIIALIAFIVIIALVAMWYVLNGSEFVLWQLGGYSMPLLPHYVLVALVVIVPFVVALAFISRKIKKPRLGPARTFGTQRRMAYHLEYCYYCGAAMPAGAIFCKKCGKSQG